ncbi:MAG: hypothetical protein GDA41_12470, partial [Rhodospirillales bacterium]|nr:hypothetical protein [Rhodospirillales bacterium]
KALQLLAAYRQVADLYGKTWLTVLERQIVLLSINRDNAAATVWPHTRPSPT